MTRNLFDLIVCGYGTKSRACCFWRGFRIGMDTRRGRAVHLALSFLDAIERGPYRTKIWLADRLMRCAMRLRGEKVSVFGWFEDIHGNRAAVLHDRMQMEIVCAYGIDADKRKELLDDLDELKSLKGACSYWGGKN